MDRGNIAFWLLKYVHFFPCNNPNLFLKICVGYDGDGKKEKKFSLVPSIISSLVADWCLNWPCSVLWPGLFNVYKLVCIIEKILWGYCDLCRKTLKKICDGKSLGPSWLSIWTFIMSALIFFSDKLSFNILVVVNSTSIYDNIRCLHLKSGAWAMCSLFVWCNYML